MPGLLFAEIQHGSLGEGWDHILMWILETMGSTCMSSAPDFMYQGILLYPSFFTRLLEESKSFATKGQNFLLSCRSGLNGGTDASAKC
jgi:hypothetical protein